MLSLKFEKGGDTSLKTNRMNVHVESIQMQERDVEL